MTTTNSDQKFSAKKMSGLKSNSLQNYNGIRKNTVPDFQSGDETGILASKNLTRWIHWLGVFILSLFTALGIQAQTTTSTFNYTGAVQSFTVPAGRTTVTIDAYGAQGGTPNSTIAAGGHIQSTRTVTPGSTLYVYVGGQGTLNAGGYNGGGTVYPGSSGAYGGGGASDVRIGGTTLSNRVIVAGGGGGTGSQGCCSGPAGGLGGGLTGGNGADCYANTRGLGGTQSGGGSGSFTSSWCGGTGVDGLYGSLGTGGMGGYTPCCTVSSNNGGAGGGGGYYGGGGSSFGGAGGGSSYSATTIITNEQGVRTGNGLVTITYSSGPTISATGTPTAFNAVSGSASTAQNITVSGSTLTNNITVTAPTGFEVSTVADSGFSGSLTLTQSSGTVANTTVYIRMSSSATGTPSGNVVLTSTGASTVNVAVSGTVTGTPSTQASNIVFSSITNVSASVSWTNGNGSNRAVFVKATNTGMASPVGGTSYTANAAFGSGTQISSTGWYCIYNGTGTSVTLTGLTTATSYSVSVIEYNGTSGGQAYLTSTATNNPNVVTTTIMSTLNYSGAITTWTVPAGVTTIHIEAMGAQGGTGAGYTGGLGASMKGDFTVTPGQVLKVLVGQQGGNNASYKAGGGGGGSFVTTSGNAPLIIAGGGSGGGGNSNPANGNPGSISGSGGNSASSTGGSGGNGGGASSGSAGGGGLTGDGALGSDPYVTSAGRSFINGGTGGAGGNCAAGGGYGGFGGGSGGEWCNQGAPGAGGGYSGGAGVNSDGLAGAGGSYNSGASPTNAAGARSGNGLVTITCYISQTIVTAGSFSAFTASSGMVSLPQSFTASGVLLTGNITITAPTGFEVSTSSGSGYAGTVTLTPASGTVPVTTIYVRMSTTATGAPSGNVALTSPGATTINVAASGTVYSVPSTQATNVTFSATTISQTNISWTNGNGGSRAVFMRAASSGSAAPVNSTTYTANTSFGSGTQIGSSGWYCVYNGTGTGVVVTNLLPVTDYIVMVTDYNGITTSENYITTTASNNPKSFITASSNSFNYTGSIFNYTVPAGVYFINIEAFGAQGGTGAGYTGGLGARMKGDFAVTPGQVLKILVGQQGGTNASYKAGGGGGGSFVTTSGNAPLIVAGGGSGGGGNSNPGNGNPGLITGSGGNSASSTGGSGGNGGGASSGSAGGGGLTGDGALGSDPYVTSAGRSFINGGTGGAGGNCAAGGGYGGFGGGSGGEWCNQGAPGAGGGYSGGAGVNSDGLAGAGGSYNSGSSPSNTAGARSGNGMVTITFYSASPRITVTGSLSAFAVCAGTASATQNFSVSAANLTSNISLAAPTGFEISTSAGSGYSGTLSLTQSSGIVTATTIYVRLAASATGAPSGNIVLTSTDASTVNLAAAGTAYVLPSFSVHPSAATQSVCLNGTATALTVTASAGSGTISTYQWYKNSSASNSGGTTIGTNSATYIPVTTTAGDSWYYCIVTNSNGCTVTSNVSGAFTVNTLPSFSASPATGVQNICLNGTATALSVTAAAGSGTISTYQWYKNSSASNSGGAAVGTNSATYTPLTTTAGTLYYYCVVTNSNGCTAISNVSGAITINALPPVPTSLTATPGAVCSGAPSNLNATSAGNNINWYTASTDGTLLGTSASGANFAVSPTDVTTYYAQAVTTTNGTQTFNYTGSASTFVVPTGVSEVTIDAYGAQGGPDGLGNAGGYGARMSGTFAVTPGETIGIAVGGQGTHYSTVTNTAGGGGGGTFVWHSSSYTEPMLAAGGGGGAWPTGVGVGLTTTAGGASANGGSGGTSGNGGAGGPSYGGGGGTGWKSDGASNSSPGNDGGKTKFGFAGGIGYYAYGGNGGFGGGGGSTHGGGGGGGYSGGGGGNNSASGGGGGGSYNAGSSQTNTAGAKSGNGQVIITWNIVSATSCPSVSRTPVTVTMTPGSVGGTATATAATLCTGGNTTITLAGHTGTIQWQQSADGSTGWANVTGGSGATTTTYTTPVLVATTYYRAMLTSGACSVVPSTTAIVTINPASVGGTVAGSATVCTGTNSTDLTLSGKTGNVTNWQSSTVSNFTSNVTYINNVTSTLTATNLTATTYYRAVVTSGLCASANSTAATVTVSPASVGGSVAGSMTVCYGTNSTTLNLSGHTGSVTRWESSLVSNFSSGVNTIANTTTSLTATNLTATTYYRAVVTNSVCSLANSSIATITVSPTSVGGTIAGTATVCTGTNSTLLTLSGHTGTIQWQSSLNNVTFSNITGETGTTYTATNLTATTYYRAMVTSGICSFVYSAKATVTVSPASIGGSVSGSATVCTGTNSTTLTLSGQVGSITRWESSLVSDFTSSVTTIGNTTTSLTASNLTATTYYRAVITSGSCALAYSATATVTVSPAAVGGTISGGTTVCSGTNSTTLTLNGSSGTVQWQSSLNNSTFTNVSGATNTSYTAENLTATTYYRAILTSGTCTATSGAATMTVTPLPTVAALTGVTTVCPGSTTTLNCSTAGGTWSSSNETFATVNSGVVSGLTAGSSTISYAVTTSGCTKTVSASVTVNASLAAPTPISATPEIIQTGGNSNLRATSEGSTISWYSASTGGTFLGTSASTAPYNVTPAATTTYYAEAGTFKSFYINTLTANNSYSLEHASAAGDDRGGIAVTQSYYYYTGDNNTVRFDMPGLSNPTSLTRRDGIFSDLSGSGTLYTLWNGSSDPVWTTNTSPFTVTAIRILNTTDLSLGATTITLSSSVTMTQKTSAVYAGSGFVILQNANTFYRVDIPSGTVTNLGSWAISRFDSENWATWGIAELNAGVYSVLYRDASTNVIKRLNLTTGVITDAATFSNLSDMTCFTYAPWYNKWYFHHEGTSQFRSGDETAGYADGTHTSVNTGGCPSTTRTPITVTINNIPTVTTTAITAITNITATSGGNVTGENGANVTARGVCWSTATAPTVALATKTTDATGAGIFASSITGLSAGTTYYVRAYATNSVGTGYGSEISFTTYSPGTIAGTQEICSGASPALFTSVTAATNMPGVTYQWQISTDNTNFSDISSATALTYQPGALSATTYFRRNAISGGTTLSSNVNTITISTGIASPSATADPATILSGASSNLNAISAGNTISWYSAATGGTLLGTSASSANFNVTPATTKTYYAEAGNSKSFYVNTMTATNSYSLEHASAAGDDRGGIAVTQSYYYYTGDNNTVRFNMPGLTSATSLTRRDGIFSDLSGSGTLYTLWNGSSDPVWTTNTSPFVVTAIRTLNADLTLGTTTITLSSSISMTQKLSAVYAGAGFVILQSGTTFYRVDIPSGTVTNLGSYTISRFDSENWATWGIAELNAGVYSVLYRDTNNQNIYRLALSGGSGAITTAATFTNLSDMTCFTYAPWYNKWYFHHEGTSQFRSGDETAGYADGTHTYSSSGSCPSLNRTAVTVTVSRIPVLSTTAVSAIGSTTATGGGNITDNGGVAVTTSGICWSTSVNPTTSSAKTTDGTDTGVFTSGMTTLTAGTTYYVRAYATNPLGTAYGNQVSFAPFTLGSFPAINKNVGDIAFALVNPSSASPGTFSYTSSNTDVATVSGNTITILTAGTSTITATQAASGAYLTATTTALLTVGKSSQTITFGALNAKTFGDVPFDVSATAGSGQTVTFTSSNTAVATVSGTTVTIIGAGNCTIYANQAGNANYNAAPQVGQALLVNKASQTITFNALAAKAYGDAAFTLSASGGASGNPVVFTSSDPAIASVSGTTVTILGAGSCNITASQAGNANYSAATPVVQSLAIGKKAQVITFGSISAKSYGDIFTVSATGGTSGNPVVFTSSDPTTATCTGTNGSTVTVLKPGDCTINANQAGNANFSAATQVGQLFTAGKKAQTITFNSLATKTFGDAEFSLSAAASSGLSVVFTSSDDLVATVSGTTVSIVGAGSCSIYANQAGNVNYSAATEVAQTLTVGKAGQVVTLTVPGDHPLNYFTGLNVATVNATSSSGLEVSVSLDATSTAGIATLTKTSAGIYTLTNVLSIGTVVINATQVGNDNYNAATTVMQSFDVTKNNQSITFNPLAAKIYGDSDFLLTATASSTLDVSYVSSNTAVATISGSTVHIVGAGTCEITASQAGAEFYNPAPNVSQQLTVNKATRVITFENINMAYGDAAFDLSASSSGTGAFTYSSSNQAVATISGIRATIVKAGTSTITVTRAADGNYNLATATALLTVSKIDQTITLTPVSDLTVPAFVAAPIQLTATSTSGLTVSLSLANENLATINESNQLVSKGLAGTVTVYANQQGNDNYNAATQATTSFVVGKAGQTITFDAIGTKTYGNEPFSLTATASSGLRVSYVSSDPTVASVSGSLVTILKAGTTDITASQAGDDSFSAAAPVIRTLTVSPATTSITFENIFKNFGDAPFTASASSASSGAITYTSSDVTVASVSGSLVTMLKVGTTNITASQAAVNDYNAATATATLNVSMGSQSITFAVLDAKTYGNDPFALTATASSGLTVTFESSNPAVATVSGNTVTIVGAGTSTITAIQTGDSNWHPATNVNRQLTVDKATPTISTFGDLNKTYGDADVTLNAGSNSSGAISYTSGTVAVGTIDGSTLTITGVGHSTLTATQEATDNYLTTSVTADLNVVQKSQIITFNALSSKYLGDPDFILDATTTSSLDISYESSNTAVATVSGKTVTIVGVGTAVITASQAGNANYSAATSVARNLVVTNTGPSITGYDPIGACQGTTVTINGTYLYGATEVSFGGTAAASFTVVNASQITAVAGAGTSGDVSVTTPGGTATRAGMTVYPTSAVGAASAAASPICAGPGTSISLASHTGTIQWQIYNTTSSAWENISGATGTNSGTVAQTAGTFQYRAVVTSGSCSSVTSNTVTVQVDPVTVAGTAATTLPTICSGTKSKITLADQIGAIQWQVYNGAAWVDISGATSDSYTTPNLTIQTKYRAYVKSGICSSELSNEVTINIDPVSVSGTATASLSTICSGSTSEISLAGNIGTIQWQKFDNGLESWVDLTGETASSYSAVSLTVASDYRAKVTSGVCSETYSNSVHVAIDPTSVSGTATSAVGTVCFGFGTTLSLTGQTGAIQWQQSADGSTGWATVSGGSGGTSATYTTPLLVNAVFYRAVVTSGVCSVATSNTVAIAIDPVSVAGTATAVSSVICSGNSAVINLAGSTGSVQWQESENGTDGWVNITGATSVAYTSQVLNGGTYHYRALVTSGVCSTQTSNVVDVLVNFASILGGSISGSGSITYGSSTGTLTLSGNTGSVQKWQSKLGSGSWIDIANTALTYSETPSSAGTWYYRAVVASGACAVENSLSLTVVVHQKELTVTGASVTTKPYDKTDAATITGAVLTGKVTGDVVVLENATTGIFTSSAKGTEIPVSTTMTISGAQSGNYFLTQPMLTGDIGAKTITVTGASVTTKAYDKTDAATITGATLSGVESGDLVVLTNATTGTFAQSTVGNNISVATTPMAIVGTQAVNYSLTQPVLTGNIIQKALTVTGIQAVSRPYNRLTPTALTCKSTLFGIETGDVVNVNDTLVVAEFVTPNVGENKTVNVSGLTLFGTDNANYSLTLPVLTADVTAKELTVVSATVTPKIYDGDTDAVITGATLSGIETGDEVILGNKTSGVFERSTAGTNIPVTTSMTITGTHAANYTITQPTLLGVINTKELTVTGATVTTKVYNSNAGAVITGATLSGVLGSDEVILGNHTTGTFAQTTAGSNISVATVPMTISGSESPNYHLTQPVLTGTIAVKDLRITAINQTKIYGATFAYNVTPSDSADYVVTGIEAGDAVASITLSSPGEGPTASTAGSPYTITPSAATGTGLNNYHLVYETATMTLFKAMLTVRADVQTKYYGDANPTLSYTYTGWKNGDVEAGLTTKPTAVTTVVSNTPVGTYTNAITISEGADDDYDFNYLPANFSVTKAMVQVTADDKNKYYGDDNPMLTLTYDGLKNGETDAILATKPVPSTAVSKTTNVGVYNGAITVGGGADGNYDFTYTSGKFTVEKATITVTADPKTKVYGTANPALTASYSGFVNDENLASSGITGSPALTNPETNLSAAGSYTITAAVGTLSSSNYTFIFVNGTLTISKAMLTVTAQAKTKIYGNTNPAYTFAYSGWVNGVETIDTEPTGNSAIDLLTPVDVYTNAITYSGGVDGNYEFTYMAANFTVTKSMLTVTADAKTKIYGDPNPMLTVNYSGWKNSENDLVLTTKPVASTTANLLTAVGLHTGVITISGGVDENYDFTYVSNNMTVTKAMLTVTAYAQTKIYGSENPGLGYSYSGWKNSENQSVLTAQPTISTSVNKSSAAGTYAGDIRLTGGVDENYDFTYVAGTFTVTKAMLTVVAESKTKIYGDNNPEFSFSYSGWTNGVESIDSEPGADTSVDILTPVGYYSGAINYSGGFDGNYEFTYVGADFEVTKAMLTITADSKTKVFGSANPLLSLQYSGWKNKDDFKLLTLQPMATTTVSATTPVGFYTNSILVAGGADENYNFTYIPANFTITKGMLMVYADAKTKVYRSANPALTFRYSGWQNSDNESVLTIKPIISTTVTPYSTVGTFTDAISVSGGSDENYNFTYFAADFSITTKSVTPRITASNKCIDGNTVATLSSQTLEGLVSPDVVTLVAAAANFSDANPGTGKLVTASKLSLGGANAFNYTLTEETATAKADIFEVSLSPISGPITACAGSGGYAYTVEAGMTEYNWQISNGGTITSGAGTSTITVLWSNVGAQTLSVGYTNKNGCKATVPSTYNVMVNTLPPATITGSSVVCRRSTGVVYTTEAGMASYDWVISSGGYITKGRGTNTIEVTWDLAGNQTVSVNFTSLGGCTASSPTVKSVIVNPQPESAGIITGINMVCGGTQSVTYTIPEIANATTYIWTVPTGASIVSGDGTRSVTINYANNASSGVLTVYGSNGCGIGMLSNMAINLSAPPAAAGAIAGTSAVCQGSGGLIFSVAPIDNATGYTWSVPSGASIVNGSNSTSIVVNLAMGAVSGPITVYATNNCGKGTVSPAFNLTINPIPVTPTITVVGSNLVSSATDGNKWFFSPIRDSYGTELSGTTAKTITPAQTGWYWTQVNLLGCASDVSNTIYRLKQGEEDRFSVYPVPNNGEFTVDIITAENEEFDIQVYTQLGQKIFELPGLFVNGQLKQSITLGNVATGIYSVVIRNKNGGFVAKKFNLIK